MHFLIPGVTDLVFPVQQASQMSHTFCSLEDVSDFVS